MSQPIEMYPNPNPFMRQPNTNSSHNNGSFGPVFIVLAVIVVLSSVACVLGRLCSRRHHRVKEVPDHHPKASKHQSGHSGGGLGPKEWESRQKPTRDGDIEFGFDKRLPSAKSANNGGAKAKPPQFNVGGNTRQVQFYNEGRKPEVQFYNGGRKPEVRFANNV